MPAQKGLNLREASRAYASNEILQLLNRAKVAMDSAMASKWWQAKQGQTLNKTFDQIAFAQQLKSDLENAVEVSYVNLTNMLYTGALVSTGIRTMPTVEIKPGPIPFHIFDNPSIDWQRDTVQNAGSKFELVRVHGAEARPEAQTGRPTKKISIVRWLTEIALEGDDLAGNQDRLCDLVKRKAAGEGLSRDGLSDSVIKPLIRQVRKTLSKNDT